MIEQPLDASSYLLTASGELDIATAPLLRERLTALIEEGASGLVLDLCPVTFMDSVALAAVLHARARLGDDGRMAIVRRRRLLHPADLRDRRPPRPPRAVRAPRRRRRPRHGLTTHRQFAAPTRTCAARMRSASIAAASSAASCAAASVRRRSPCASS